ncbi:AAA family ATPase [Arenimonas sp.]|nr:AAA family ATPase [Candidatus Parcubacteria bacterium]
MATIDFDNVNVYGDSSLKINNLIEKKKLETQIEKLKAKIANLDDHKDVKKVKTILPAHVGLYCPVCKINVSDKYATKHFKTLKHISNLKGKWDFVKSKYTDTIISNRNSRFEQLKQSKYEAKAKVKNVRNDVEFVKITLSYTVSLYMGGTDLGSTKRTSSDYVKLFLKDRSKRKIEVAQGIEKAVALFKNRILKAIESNADLDSWDAETIEKISSKELNEHAKNPTIIKMKRSLPIDYRFIEGINLNVPTQDGMCVDEYLLKTYKRKIPSLTVAKINDIISMTLCENINGFVTGRSIQEVQVFCSFYKISHYAIDVRHKLLHKSIVNSRNYPALIYYMIDEHMYPVTHQATRDHITNVHSANKTVNSLLKQEYDPTKTIERFDLPFFEDVPMDKLDTYKDCNIFYHNGNLHDMLIDLFKTTNIHYKSKHKGDIISCIHFENNVRLYSNANHKIGNTDWKDAKVLCDLAKISFKNQSIPAISYEIFESFHTKGTKRFLRSHTSKAIKDTILASQNSCCKICKVKLISFEIDHVKSLASGGDNDIKNLQALCKSCHNHKSNKEASERLFNMDNIISSYNATTQDIFTKSKNGFIHNFKGIKDVQKRVNNKESEVFGIDINKCRKNIAKYSQYDYCVFSVLDDITEFTDKHKDIPIGYYYIVSDNLFPLKGNGWYSYPLIRYCLEQNIICQQSIKYYLAPSLSLQSDYFNKFIDYVYSLDTPHYKIMINGFLGMFGNKITKTTEIYLTRSINEASYHYFNNNNVFIVPNSNNDETFFEIVHKKETYQEDSYVPIFNQILDIELMELHKVACLLKRNNGVLIYTNTDNVIAEFANELKAKIPSFFNNNRLESGVWDLDNTSTMYSNQNVVQAKKEMENEFWDDGKKVAKYKVESTLKDKNGRTENKDETVLNYAHPTYKVIQDVETNDVSGLVKQLVGMDSSFQIDGRAGVGKTFLINAIRKELDRKQMSYICLAPTHKAKALMGRNAETIHSFFSKFSPKSYTRMNKYNYIIIDEKSMIKELFFRLFLSVKQNTSCKFILAGDWAQLPPVQDRSSDFDYSNSSAIHRLCDGNLMQLSKCRRADDELFNICKSVNSVKASDFGSTIHPRGVCYHNSQRIKMNEFWMKKKRLTKYITISKLAINQNSQDMFIFRGLPVMAHVTNKEYKVNNCDEFTVKHFNKETITVLRKNDSSSQLIVKHADFAKLFYPAYYITLHKSQGSTFDKPYTILEWNVLDEKLKYIALSRSTKKELINILQ